VQSDRETTVDGEALRRAVGQFATGVTVITAVAPEGTPVGCTVSAFCSLSLTPPLVLVCIGRDRSIHRLLSDGPGYAVNVLRADQTELASRFAGSAEDRFAGVEYLPGRHGNPLLTGAISHLECDRYDVLLGGDHTIVVGLVRAVSVGDGEPLLYAQGAFIDLHGRDWDRAVTAAPHEWLLSPPPSPGSQASRRHR
jgi:flavin reductase (DIM6/NTAB) family NADH-FMN oxidoreductase RutF